MPRTLTPQELAAAVAKRAAAVAARQATGGMTVRQQRAAAAAAKAGQPTPPPPTPRAPVPPRQSTGRRRRSGRRFNGNGFGNPIVTPSAPIFSTPKPSVRPLKLAALAAIEDVFKTTPPSAVTPELRATWAKYQKVKTLALAVNVTGNAALDATAQTEADSALRRAVLMLVGVSF